MITPHKIVGQVFAKRTDEDGEIIGEFVAGEIIIYATKFDDLRQVVAENWQTLIEQAEAKSS
jgi:hypothetical protein